MRSMPVTGTNLTHAAIFKAMGRATPDALGDTSHSLDINCIAVIM